eukprot:gb/GEZN01018868.1/.p1 GENE.gb/GEZN01018868.1/~~gb/GEZN01018868.1/.p1  ORF type:complete len:210 (-),score=6.74 gb/GEZN01018868.1/:33-662(-)
MSLNRECADCGEYLESWEYSNSQWRKGDGASRCQKCVDYGLSGRCWQCDYCGRGFQSERNMNTHMMYCKCRPPTFACKVCDREFINENSLHQHMKVHKPKKVSCPVCGVRRFASAANAVQHVESGYCPGCRGKKEARQAIYEYTGKKAPHLLRPVPVITDGRSAFRSKRVPEHPYECSHCGKAFHNMSQMLQHEEDKHRVKSAYRIGYN